MMYFFLKVLHAVGLPCFESKMSPQVHMFELLVLVEKLAEPLEVGTL